MTTPGGTIEAAVRRYLHERRQLGFALKASGTELLRFARFADARGHHGPLTQELQFDWARAHVLRTGVVTATRRIEIVRPFAAYYRQFEVDTEVPALGILGRGHTRLVSPGASRGGWPWTVPPPAAATAQQ